MMGMNSKLGILKKPINILGSILSKPGQGLLVVLSLVVLMSFSGSWKLLNEIKIQAKDIQTDNIGNLYVVSQTNQLYKYDPNGKLLSTLNYAYLGNITHIDASNPLELYLFYRELNAVVFLDNNLAYRGRINLSDAGIVQAAAMGRSYSNGIWIFDQGDLQLKKLNKDGSLIQGSGNVMQFAKSENLNPSGILDNGNRVYVNDSAEGILVFDVFANYIKTLPIKGCGEIKVSGSDVMFAQKGKLIQYKQNALQYDTFVPPDTAFLEFKLEADRLFLLKPDVIKVFAWENK